MVFLPVLEILFYIAVFFAPENADSFTLQIQESDTLVFERVENGWKRQDDGSVWRIDGQSVVKGSETSEPLGAFAERTAAHDWCEASVLELPHNYAALKVRDGFEVYPNGLADPDRRVAISYSTSQ